ncbi:hypothetical protein QJS04_geneDACA018011 [Acorus gramineus]|uniref:Ankyrin repeat domain-containing protein n=1 Tax=Acorus gramineus TaxID=55184 RepID=A0AAV9ABE4_ACOGR|nr:hypothetical protein QJS04_geneDACA018011 [Acorus gramineus]
MENQNQKPKQNPKKKPVGPARPNPLAYAHSPAHSAILSGDPSALRRLLSSLPNPPSSVLDRRDVPHRETPLHLALRLGDLSAAAAIAAAGADASLRSSSGWSPLDDALCLHGPTLASALLRHHHRHAVLRWRRRLPRLAAALRRSSSKDFYMEVSFRFESHVIPFVGRIAPSDTYRIRKSGADVRADTSLAGFDGFRIRRSDRSFLFLGDRNPSRPSLLILDRASKRVYEAMEMEGEPSMPRSTEEEFVTQKYVCMAGVDFAEAKLVKKTNWLKQEVKERVGQYKAKLFEIHNVNFSRGRGVWVIVGAGARGGGWVLGGGEYRAAYASEA